MDTERPISDWPGYSATSCGRVFGPNGEKKQSALKHGHRYVSFWKDGKSYKRYVHRLVVEAFLGPIPDGMQVCHNDGDPANNQLENLRVDTAKGNAADTVKHGTRVNGERNGHAKLTKADVDRIRSLAGSRRGIQRELACYYGVSEVTISQIVNYKVWRGNEGL